MSELPARADVVVVGLGAAGSAALDFLARAGAKAVGIDRYAPPHDLGSSHGETRMLRTAYSEGTAYVPMVRRAIALWRELEERSGASLFHQTGVFYGGPQNSPFLAAAKSSAREMNVELAEDIAPGYGLALPAAWQALLDIQGGYLEAEPSLAAFLANAEAHGAKVVRACRCQSIERTGERIRVQTDLGAIEAGRVVVTAGAWASALLPELSRVTHVERRVLHWFEDRNGQCSAASGFRPFLITTEDDAAFYGFPTNRKGEVKVAEHFQVEKIASPDVLERNATPCDIALIRPLVARFLPGLGAHLRSSVCMYPMSADENFIIDRLPGEERIIFAAGLCGHGFKFAPVIGEALANLVLDQPQEIDLGFFSLRRFD